MRKIFILISLLFAFANLTNAQISSKTKQATKAYNVYQHPKNCSPYTAMLVSDYKQKKGDTYLKERFNLSQKNGKLYVSSFLKVKESVDIQKMTTMGIVLNSKSGAIYTALIPIENLEPLFSVKGVEYVDIAQKVEMKLDNARTLTSVNEVHAGTNLSQAYTGEGVIVGIIDGGFDYTHPTFYNSGGSEYRISRVWNQKEEGNYPTGLEYGNELIGKTAILAAKHDGLGEGSHGTHVAGIAGGSGSVSSAYKGVAYGSELVLVPTDMSTKGIADGIYYILDYAASVDKPAVVNISIGGHSGPHDGTSTFDQWCEGIVGEGAILVGAAGNEGSDNLHLDYQLGNDETVYSFIEFPGSSNNTNGDGFIDIWGEVGKQLTVAVNVYNIDTDKYQDYTDYISTSTNGVYEFTLDDGDFTFSDEVSVKISVEKVNANNNKPHITIDFDNTDQDETNDIYDYVMLEIKGTNTSFDAWQGAAIFTNLNYAKPIINGNSNKTVGEIGGTGKAMISVGAYTSKNQYTDFQDNTHQIDSYGGAIAPFSSLGPTADGRIKPDITAPGNVIVSSVNRFDTEYTSTSPEVVSGLNNGIDTWWFATMQGTSMASPMVAGIVALWLEANPLLTPDEIKQLMKENAWTDNLGTIPNNTWGYGRINAHETIKDIERMTGIAVNDLNETTFAIYPNPVLDNLTIANINLNSTIMIFDISGKLLINKTAQSETEILDVSHLTSGIYTIRIQNEELVQTSKLIKQ